MVDEARAWSLRRRLIGMALATTLTGCIAAAVVLYAVASEATGRVFDAAIAQAANLLLDFADHEYVETGGALEPVVHAAASENPALHYQVWSADRRLLLRSDGAPRRALAGDFAEGLADRDIDGERWRVYVLRSQRSALQIQMGEPYAYRRMAARRMVFAMLATVLLCIAVLLGALWILVDRIASRVGLSVREIGERSARDLSPLSPTLLPVELAPLIVALNALLTRLETALDHERRFAANASHELRTPLAVIRAQAELAQRARTPQSRDRALRKLEAGIARATHLTEQLLSTARLDPLLRPSEDAVLIDVREEIRETLESYQGLIARKRLRVSTDIADSRWHGHPALVRVLLRNLVDNALRYCDENGEVKIRYVADTGSQRLEISDSGPGIPLAERERVFEPFYRLPSFDDDSGSTGSGLGLSIARRIVQGLGGRIEFDTGLHGRGVTVRVQLPSHAPPR